MVASLTAFLRLQVPMESQFLDESLATFRPIADDLVIVDTGENEYADAIAAKHGARVVRMPWQQNYSAVLNTMLAEARGKWMIWMDADEFLLDGAEQIREIVARNEPRWGTIRCIHFEDPISTFEEARSVRLMPALATLEFADKYDPKLIAPGMDPAEFEAGWLDTEIKIAHKAYLHNEVIIQKNRRWAEMRRTQLQQNPADRSSRLKLAGYLVASRVWEAALAEYEQWIDKADDNDADLAPTLLRAATCALTLGRVDQALEYAQRALTLEPNFSDASYMIGTSLLKKGDLDAAEQALQAALSLREKAPYFLLIDRSMSGWKPLSDLAEVYRLRKQPEQALSYVKQSLDEYPTNYRAFLQYAALFKQLGQREQAVAAYQKALDLNPGLAARKASR